MAMQFDYEMNVEEGKIEEVVEEVLAIVTAGDGDPDCAVDKNRDAIEFLINIKDFSTSEKFFAALRHQKFPDGWGCLITNSCDEVNETVLPSLLVTFLFDEQP